MVKIRGVHYAPGVYTKLVINKQVKIRIGWVSNKSIDMPNINTGENKPSEDKIVGYDVWLIDVGASKIDVIKVVRSITGLGLKEAKDLIESAPVSIIQTDNEEVAQSAYNDMTAVGDDVVAEIRYIYE